MAARVLVRRCSGRSRGREKEDSEGGEAHCLFLLRLLRFAEERRSLLE
jgi:hypothetical protein